MSEIISLGIGSPASVDGFILLGLESAPPLAAPYQIISQGIGSPAGIGYFLLLGLTPEGQVTYTAVRTLTVDGRELSATLRSRYTRTTLAARDTAVTLDERDTTGTLDGRENTLTLKEYTD